MRSPVCEPTPLTTNGTAVAAEAVTVESPETRVLAVVVPVAPTENRSLLLEFLTLNTLAVCVLEPFAVSATALPLDAENTESFASTVAALTLPLASTVVSGVPDELAQD